MKILFKYLTKKGKIFQKKKFSIFLNFFLFLGGGDRMRKKIFGFFFPFVFYFFFLRASLFFFSWAWGGGNFGLPQNLFLKKKALGKKKKFFPS